MNLTNAGVLVAVACLSVVAPAGAAGQDGGVTIQGAAAAPLNANGNSQTLSLGLSPNGYFDFVLSGERLHTPSEVTRSGNVFHAIRGGTSKYISVEMRAFPVTIGRLSPYGLAGAGLGTSRSNVTELFPRRVTNEIAVLFFGGGVRMKITEAVGAFADLRFLHHIEGNDGTTFVPLRAGLAWRF